MARPIPAVAGSRVLLGSIAWLKSGERQPSANVSLQQLMP